MKKIRKTIEELPKELSQIIDIKIQTMIIWLISTSKTMTMLLNQKSKMELKLKDVVLPSMKSISKKLLKVFQEMLSQEISSKSIYHLLNLKKLLNLMEIVVNMQLNYTL